MMPPFLFHHIGLACLDLEVERCAHLALGFEAEGDVFVDPVQRIRGQFLRSGAFRVELLIPTTEDSPLHGFLRRGQKMYHQAFEVADLAAAVRQLRAAGALLVVPPCPAVAFGGRKICFLMLKTEMLVELIAASQPEAAPSSRSPAVKSPGETP